MSLQWRKCDVVPYRCLYNGINLRLSDEKMRKKNHVLLDSLHSEKTLQWGGKKKTFVYAKYVLELIFKNLLTFKTHCMAASKSFYIFFTFFHWADK